MTQATTEQLVAAQGAAQVALTKQAIAQLRAKVIGFTAWYDEQQVQLLASRISAAIQSVQRASASVTDAFMSRTATQITGRSVKAVGAVNVTHLRAGVELDQVYTRLARNYRWLVSEQKTADQALRSVVQRGQAMASTDVQLAQRAQWQKFMQGHNVSGYRRVIHPELAKGGSCGLCIAASDRVYHVDQLLPIHDGCHCGVLPIINGIDVGRSLNEADLKRLYLEAGSTHADQLKRVQWVIHEHGELGPVLGYKGQQFRSESDLPTAA